MEGGRQFPARCLHQGFIVEINHGKRHQRHLGTRGARRKKLRLGQGLRSDPKRTLQAGRPRALKRIFTSQSGPLCPQRLYLSAWEVRWGRGGRRGESLSAVSTFQRLPIYHAPRRCAEVGGGRVERRRRAMAPGLPLSPARLPLRPLFGESRPAVSDSSVLAAPPDGVGDRGTGETGGDLALLSPGGKGRGVRVPSAGVPTPLRPTTAGPQAGGKQGDRAGGREPSGGAGGGEPWRRNEGQRALAETSPYLKPAAHRAPVGTVEKGVEALPQLPWAEITPISQTRENAVRTRGDERVFCAQPQHDCSPRAVGSVAVPLAPRSWPQPTEVGVAE